MYMYNRLVIDIVDWYTLSKSIIDFLLTYI